jgi:adenine-specific DNA-methyltransferase
MLKLLETHAVDRYFRCISGSSNVSLFELEQVPLPDPSELQNLLNRGVSIEEATYNLLVGVMPDGAHRVAAS